MDQNGLTNPPITLQ